MFQPLTFGPMLKFISGKMSQDIFGNLTEDRNESKTLQDVKLQVKRTFEIDFNFCHSIATSVNETIWICDQFDKTIIVYKQSGEIFSKQRKLHHKVYDMHPFHKNSVVIADRTSSLKIIHMV